MCCQGNPLADPAPTPSGSENSTKSLLASAEAAKVDMESISLEEKDEVLGDSTP